VWAKEKTAISLNAVLDNIPVFEARQLVTDNIAVDKLAVSN